MSVNASVKQQQAVFEEALSLFAERNAGYQDNWKRQGWRGSMFKLRLKVERAWEVLWSADPARGEAGIDDLLDAINNAAFAIRSIRDGNRDGEWEYPA